MSNIITPDQKAVEKLNKLALNTDLTTAIRAFMTIEDNIVLHDHDSSAYTNIITRHFTPQLEASALLRTRALETLKSILRHEFANDTRLNPHMPYVPFINHALDVEKDKDALFQAVACYGVIAENEDYMAKTTEGLEQAVSGLQNVAYLNVFASKKLKEMAMTYIETFNNLSDIAMTFNGVSINFGIPENLDPEERNNMTLFTEVQNFTARAEEMKKESKDGKIQLLGEFNSAKTMVEIPYDALGQIEKDMLFCRSTTFKEAHLLRSGRIIAQDAQPT